MSFRVLLAPVWATLFRAMNRASTSFRMSWNGQSSFGASASENIRKVPIADPSTLNVVSSRR